MAVYQGVNGVVRKAKAVQFGRSGEVKHAMSGWAGVDGVIRRIFAEPVGDIDHIEISLDYVYLADINTGTQETSELVLTNLAEAQKYGNITTGSNYIEVNSYTLGKYIYFMGNAYIVHKNGHKHRITDYLRRIPGVPISFNITAYLYCGSGYQLYISEAFGSRVIDGTFSTSASNTVTITTFENNYIKIASGMTQSGSGTCRQTYNSVTISGNSYPITIVNNLT